jgi:hypothetical protein
MGRYVGLQFFPVLKQFCVSDIWVPVYLDETGAVFVRRSPETEALIGRFRVDCSTAPVPAAAPVGNSTEAFNQWSNAASVLKALGRNQEALVAIRKALEIFPDNGYLHFTRGHIFEEEGDQNAAERDFLAATEMEPNLVAPWSALAAYYQEQGRLADAIRAWEKAASVSRSPWEPLENLGYADLMARRPQQALAAFAGTFRVDRGRHVPGEHRAWPRTLVVPAGESATRDFLRRRRRAAAPRERGPLAAACWVVRRGGPERRRQSSCRSRERAPVARRKKGGSGDPLQAWTPAPHGLAHLSGIGPGRLSH